MSENSRNSFLNSIRYPIERKFLNQELIKIHIQEKQNQGFTDKKYDTFFDGKVLQICFFSKGCRCSKNGSCIICDYGKTRKENLTKTDITEIMNEIFESLDRMPNVVLLNSLGSVLDTQEMPMENIIVILDKLSEISANVIIFETHYLTINPSILEVIKQKLKDKEVVIELGLESSNREVRENCLNKYIDNAEFVKRVNLIKSFGFGAEANVIFGAPFLTTEEQIRDTIQSIEWCFENSIDEVNLFPINIKPYTLLYKLYEEGKYSPVSHSNFIEVLKKVPKEYIHKLYLCWYGNREIKYDTKRTVLPKCEKDEYSKLMDFYQRFNINKDPEERIKLLESTNQFKLEKQQEF